VKMCENNPCSGWIAEIAGPFKNSRMEFKNDAISYIDYFAFDNKASPRVTLFEHDEYKGNSKTFETGSVSTDYNSDSLGKLDNEVSSIAIPEGVGVIIYDSNR